MSNKSYPHIPLEFKDLPEAVMIEQAKGFYDRMNRRRSVRFFFRQSGSA